MPRKARKSTIFDVAAAAGVSIKTVSRVVNKESNVREKTRQKVRDAISRLDYQPSNAARGLSGGRSWAIGLIYENPHEFSYVGDVLNGAIAACEDLGYALLLRPLTLPNPSLLDSVRQFALQARVDGVVLPAPICNMPDVLELLHDLEIPVAAITPKSSSKTAVNILCEDEQASFELAEHVIERGHRRIGFIKGHPDHGASAERFAGYRRALKAHGIGYDASLVRQGYFDFESGHRAANRLLGLDRKPSVILASNDDMAAGVLFAAKERDLDVPAELSIVGFDDTQLAAHMWPPLTTVRQPIRQMADMATRLLVRRLRGETIEAPPPFQCEVVIRRSTADC